MWHVGSGLYPSHFIDEVLDKVVLHEVYLLLDGFFGYHQIQIAPGDGYKMIFRSICLGAYAIWTEKCVPYVPKSGEQNFQRLFGWFHEVIFGQFQHLSWFGHPFAQITMMLQKMPRVHDKMPRLSFPKRDVIES